MGKPRPHDDHQEINELQEMHPNKYYLSRYSRYQETINL